MKFFWKFFDTIPIRDQYKVAHPESIVLLAQPTIIRICVVLEVITVVTVFIYSYYITAATGTTETTVTFEILDSSYYCSILAPRKDIEELNTLTSELAAFSSSRYDYDQCIYALGEKGMNVCADGNYNEYVLTVTGISSDDDNCEQLFLSDGYRFCYGKEEVTSFWNSAYSSSFARQSDYNYNSTFDVEGYYFVYGDGNYIPISSDLTSLDSDFIVGSDNDVFVLAEDSRSVVALYKFSPNAREVELAAGVQSASSDIFGLTYGADCAYVYLISSGNKRASITVYNTTSGSVRTANNVVDCSTSFSTTLDIGGSSARYISFGSDGFLYVMCTKSTKVDILGQKLFPFYQINPRTLTLMITRYAKIDAVMVSQVFNLGGKMIFISAEPDTAIIVGSLQDVSLQGQLQNLAITGSYSGTYAIAYNADQLYFADGVDQFYHVSTVDSTYEQLNFLGEYYYSTRMQLGIMYQICNDNITNYLLDSTLSTSFYKSCGEINGLYYQANKHYGVPESCQGVIHSDSNTEGLLRCPEMARIHDDFISETCAESFAKVCDAAYTDNPPFSCSKTVYPTWITCLAAAFANASGVLALIFLTLKIALRQIQYHYVHEFEYDHKTERYHDLNQKRIHAMDEYLAGLEEGRVVVSYRKDELRERKQSRAILGKKEDHYEATTPEKGNMEGDVEVISHTKSYDNMHHEK